MLQSFIIYSLLIIVMMYLSYIARAKGQWKYMVYAVASYTIIFALRYGVGTDYFTYLYNFQAYSTSSGHWGVTESFEIGFAFITELIATLGLHAIIYFGVIAFAQLYVTFMPFRDDRKIYPYIVFTFMVGSSWLTYSNGLRQIMSVALWIYAIKFIAERKVWLHYLVIAIAVTMHTSSLMLIVFYPILRKKTDWITSIKVQLLMLAASLAAIKISFIQSLMNKIDFLLEMSGYGDYNSDEFSRLVQSEVVLGAGFYITLVLNVLLIVFSNKTKEYIKSKYLDVAYNLFLIGVVMKYVFISSNLFSRINYFFINLTFVISAYTLMYAHRNNQKLFYAIIALYILTFIAIISKGEENSALFVFCWQTDLFYLK